MKKLLFGTIVISILAVIMTPLTVYGVSATTVTVHKSVFQDYIPYVLYELYEPYEEPEMPLIFRTTANLNLRSGPSTNSTRLTTISRGSLVTVTDLRDGEWFAVEVHGRVGYMYAYFLEEVPEGVGILTVASGTVERIHWSEARQVITKGTPLTVIDVRTGITWQVASFSHGNHADVEPVTADDTAAMLQAWGGRWCWTPRPIHVIVGDRVFAASLNGMPHAGSTNRHNNMNGHVCMHFYGSRTHNGSRGHERDHQNAVNEAYNAAR